VLAAKGILEEEILKDFKQWRAQMNARKGLVLDANILIRAVFGQRVRQILEVYEDVAGFYSPDVCFQDARKYIPDLAERRGFDPAVGLSVLEEIGRMVEPVDRSLYEDYENLARERVLTRTRSIGR